MSTWWAPAGLTYALGGYWLALPLEYLLPAIWIPWLAWQCVVNVSGYVYDRRHRQDHQRFLQRHHGDEWREEWWRQQSGVPTTIEWR